MAMLRDFSNPCWGFAICSRCSHRTVGRDNYHFNTITTSLIQGWKCSHCGLESWNRNACLQYHLASQLSLRDEKKGFLGLNYAPKPLRIFKPRVMLRSRVRGLRPKPKANARPRASRPPTKKEANVLLR